VKDTKGNTIPTEYSFRFYTGLLGNLDKYSRVDGRDLIILGSAFGSTPKDTNWNRLADFNKEAESRNRIDSRDLSALASRFGRSTLLAAPKLLTTYHLPLTTDKVIIKLVSSKTEVSVNEELTVKVLIDNATTLYSYGFDLVFDTDKFEVIEIKEGSFLRQDGVDTSFMYVPKQDRIIIGASRLGRVAGINGSGVLAEITLKAKETAPVKFTLQKVVIENPDLKLMKAEIINLDYTSESTISSEFKVICYPNPAKDKVTFKFDLPKAGTVKIDVFNIAGEKVKEFKEHKNVGTGSIIWENIEVASGIYIYIAKVEYDTGGSEKVTGKIGVIK
jgi:hypothetical protein